MKETKEISKQLFEELVDYYINEFGTHETIRYLFHRGISVNELFNLLFENQDIERVLKREISEWMETTEKCELFNSTFPEYEKTSLDDMILWCKLNMNKEYSEEFNSKDMSTPVPEYWKQEVLYQLDEDEHFDNISDETKNEIAIDVANDIMNNDSIWDDINSFISSRIYDKLNDDDDDL